MQIRRAYLLDCKNHDLADMDKINKRLKKVAIVCGIAPHNAKGMNKGRIGMLLHYGKKPIVSWLLLNFLRTRMLNSNLEQSFYRWNFF